MDRRETRTDWGKPVKGLPVRLAGLIFTLPVLLVCLLAIAFNWPANCPAGGCSDPEFAGSLSATAFFCAVLAIYIIGAVAVVFDRVRTGWALLAGAAALAAWGIL